MRRTLLSLAAGSLLLGSGPLLAQDISINFDTDTTGAAVAAGTNLTTDATYAPWGVTFSRVGGGICGPDVYASDNHPGDFGSLPNVVSTCAPPTASDINGTIHGQVQATFDVTASQVCIAVRPDSGSQRANLTAYDASDAVVDSQDSAVGVTETLCVNGSGIKYVRFPGLGDTSTEYARFDDLEITTEGVDAGPSATFLVSKAYSDGNTDEIEGTLTCNTGLPLEQDFVISDGHPVNFVLTDFVEGAPDCTVTESGAADGYTSSFDNGSVVSGTGCEFENVTSGAYTCEITNTLEPVDFTVYKEWAFSEADTAIEQSVHLEITCENFRLGPDGDLDSGSEGGIIDAEDGDISFEIYPNWTTPQTRCRAVETQIDSAIESDQGCSDWLILTPGSAAQSCTITNTLFFEGIPTLGRYGLAVLILLTLGIAVVAFRRLV